MALYDNLESKKLARKFKMYFKGYQNGSACCLLHHPDHFFLADLQLFCVLFLLVLMTRSLALSNTSFLFNCCLKPVIQLALIFLLWWESVTCLTKPVEFGKSRLAHRCCDCHVGAVRIIFVLSCKTFLNSLPIW